MCLDLSVSPMLTLDKQSSDIQSLSTADSTIKSSIPRPSRQDKTLDMDGVSAGLRVESLAFLLGQNLETPPSLLLREQEVLQPEKDPTLSPFLGPKESCQHDLQADGLSRDK